MSVHFVKNVYFPLRKTRIIFKDFLVCSVTYFFKVLSIQSFQLIINLSPGVREHSSAFSACQFKSKSFLLFHCCPASEVGFRALLSQCMQEVLLQPALVNNLDKMCGCMISDPTAPVLFSHFACLHTAPTCSPSPSGLLSHLPPPCPGSGELPLSGHSLLSWE